MAYKKKRYKNYKKRRGYTYEFLLLPVFLIILYTQLAPKFEQLPHLPLITATVAAAMVALLYILFKVYPVVRRKHKYRTSKMADIDRMKGSHFEEYLSVYFEDLGYKILPHRGGPGDKGADLLMLSPDGRKYVVQAKRYSGKVPSSAIQQVHTARSLYKADAAIIISNYYFTKPSIAAANELNIELWDRKVLMEHMYAYQSQKKREGQVDG